MGNVLIVGAGAAGVSCAFELREAGFDGDVVLIDRERRLPYDRPSLTKEVLSVAGSQPPLLAANDTYSAHKIELRLGTSVSEMHCLDRIAICDGQPVAFDTAVISTGLEAIRPAIDGIDEPGVLTVRTAADAELLRAALIGARDVVVIGAGFLGAEVASAALSHGASVTIIEGSPSPLGGRIVPELGDELAALIRASGVDLWCDSSVVAIETVAGRKLVRCATGASAVGDVVLVAAGARPVRPDLWGHAVDPVLGAPCDEGLIVAPNVWAAGDVAMRMILHGGRERTQQWEDAQAQGRHVARSIVGGTVVPYDSVAFGWSMQFGHAVHIVGRPGAGTSAMRWTRGRRRLTVLFDGDRAVGGLAIDHLRGARALREALEQRLDRQGTCEALEAAQVGDAEPFPIAVVAGSDG